MTTDATERLPLALVGKVKRQPPTRPGSDKTLCPRCGKSVKRHGLSDHLRDAHDEVIF